MFAMENPQILWIGANMGSEKGECRRRRDFEEDIEEARASSRRPRVDPDERDEYDEWRQERGSRGRKRRTSGRQRYRENDENWRGS